MTPRPPLPPAVGIRNGRPPLGEVVCPPLRVTPLLAQNDRLGDLVAQRRRRLRER